MASWHLAPSLKVLVAEVDARWPKRKRGSDGTIGDDSHAARASEHNPDRDDDPMPRGAVSAADITKDSVAQMTAIRKALIDDPRTWYVIHAGRIYRRKTGFKSEKYNGPNPHTNHLHVSVLQTKRAHDDTGPWGIAGKGSPKPDAKPKVEPKEPCKVPDTLKRGSNRNTELVSTLQRFLGVDESGFADRTTIAVERFQQARGLKVDGIVGPKTWAVILTALDLPGYTG